MVTVFSLLVVDFCAAAETVEVQVEHDDDAYHIYFEILLDAPKERVKTILSDYGNLSELSTSIVKSEILSGQAGQDATVDITLRPCVWKLCKTLRKVSEARINAYNAIVYTVVPEKSDFQSGRETVIVSNVPESGLTRVTYNASLVPKFFVPPLLGSWLIRRHVSQNVKDSSERVERLARGN